LPWTGFKKDFEGEFNSLKEYLKERSKIECIQELIRMAPVKFQKMIIKLLSLEFSEAPPY